MLQPTGAPAVKVNRVRPALVFPQEEAGRLLKAAKAQDVRAGGVFSAGPAGVQVWSEPWDDEGGSMGTSVHLGSVDWTYNTPTQFYITHLPLHGHAGRSHPRSGSRGHPQAGA